MNDEHQHPEDRRWMWRALELARRAEGQTRPNPAVGCVIVRDGKPLGEGYHLRAGLPHAERDAIMSCKEDPRGATAYVTLEPCNHHGRTPPCVDALIEAGVAAVVVAQEDPNPEAGGGIDKLRAAGIDVRTGVMRGEAMRLNPGFNTVHLLGRPLVTLKWAMSADGCTSADGGHSQWITGEKARQRAHALRAAHDTVAVGRETAERDQCRLTIRDAHVPDGPPLRRIVLDSQLRIDPAHPLIAAKDSPAVIVCADDAPKDRERALVDAGAQVLRVPSGDGGLQLLPFLCALRDGGAQSLLVEGGRTLAGRFLQEKLFDRVSAFVAPVAIGAGANPLSALATPEPIESMDDAVRLHHPEWEVLGDDALMTAWATDHLFPDDDG